MVPRGRGGIPLRAIPPNVVTALALCVGLTSIRFAINGQWEVAVVMILAAALLDGIDGRIARFMRGESRFGAELDSLSDVIAFGVAPAVMLYLWSLQNLRGYGWMIALVHALCCALRLARFNAQIDLDHQPHKSAGFLTGVPAPAGAMLALAPLYLWIWSEDPLFRQPWLVGPWTALVALLMVSSVATWSAASIRVKERVRFEVVVLLVVVAAAIVSAPWPALSVVMLLYLASIPLAMRRYARIRRLAEAPAGTPAAPGEPGA
ncbi:CDP-diacylglycerol--serine O-phosphatidyltransferase [Sphingomonas canadensis]|uniref:CDP-diacylglycerol--serine O-phosphatidyltransferase n=1 Tax=Sphingomonas canadensis TaxID=1219257 RepID=A0ABW3HA38_9SPHN|nr:CDP-diacylglycerol--serine O-phosphatidyltransferase [Sphingomonas canadensis]MCW3837890.1 CDP-diacylglycerol--serine O-phosphatidyltransferase [Sphingomonas canadensis]